jgi:hypothetical protein
MVWLDLDNTVIQTYGYAKQAAGRGYTGVKGLNALVATASALWAAPVIAATRLRRVPDFVGHGYEPGDKPGSTLVTVLSPEYPENVAAVLLGVAWDRSRWRR